MQFTWLYLQVNITWTENIQQACTKLSKFILNKHLKTKHYTTHYNVKMMHDVNGHMIWCYVIKSVFMF